MAISTSSVWGPAVPGAERCTVTDITLDDDYPTGGYALAPEDLGLERVDFTVCTLQAPSSQNAVEGAAFDGEALICLTAGVETTDEQDLTDAVVRVLAVGK